jgi:hypothetical protein
VLNLEKIINFHKGYAEFHIQRPFFDNKNSILKILGLKIQTVEIYSSASSTRTNFYFWRKTKISIFGGISKFRGQILAVLGSFGMHWQWLTACPNFG